MLNLPCWLTRRRLGAYRDAELGSAARAKIEGHLGRCEGCAAELAGLERLRAAMRVPVPEPSEAAWQAFWPQVRAQLAVRPAAVPERRRHRAWEAVVGTRRLAVGTAVAVAGLATLVVLGPWREGSPPGRPPVVTGSQLAGSELPTVTPVRHAVVRAVQTSDPQSSVMIYTNPEAEMTVVWVFGLEPTGR